MFVRIALVALLAASAAAEAATVKIALLTRADDERIAPRRAELMYPGQPGGSIAPAIEMAIDEASFELGAAKVDPAVEMVEVNSPADAAAMLKKLEAGGAAAAIVDLPAAWLGPAASAVKMAVFNTGSADDALRGAGCAANLWHTLPSERMRADALAQALVARRWQRLLILHGAHPEDAARLAVAQASAKRFGLKANATKAFKLSADPRERDLGNVALLTAPASSGGEYDVVWVIDSDGEFARLLPYRTALPRPVVGDGGLTAQAWAPNFDRFGAPQLARRFAKTAKRAMTGHDWAAYMAAKAVLQAAVENAKAPTAAAMQASMRGEKFVLDGFKGTRVTFRPWDRQMRQPMMLTDGVGVIGMAPVEGVLHPKNVLDTLGADQAESACKTK